MAKPPVEATLVWQGGLRLAATAGLNQILLDSDGVAGPTPPQALAMALAGCMAIDVVDIIHKGRHPLRALRTSLVGRRLSEPPSRFTDFTLHFSLRGEVPLVAVERAVQLSRDKYCSVWHSLRQDIALETTIEVRP
jgi:putative redox protein